MADSGLLWLIGAFVWAFLHLTHYHVRHLFLVHFQRESWKSTALRAPWQVFQNIQKVCLFGCYGLVMAGLIVDNHGKRMTILVIAIIAAGACPDHWRRAGTIPYLYFEVVVITACCGAMYSSVEAAKKMMPIRDAVLLGSLPVASLLHYILVLRARRTHMPITATAPMGVMSQFLAEQTGSLDVKLKKACESFHALCNINKIEAFLERAGSGIAIALYDVVGHCVTGAFLVAVGSACLTMSKLAPFESAVQGWILYGSLLVAQGAYVGCIYLHFTLRMRRSNPFSKELGLVFTGWWTGKALSYVSQRAGRWRRTQAGDPDAFNTMMPLLPNPSQAAVGLIMWVQPELDQFVAAAGAALSRLAIPIRGYIGDDPTSRKTARIDWPIKGFSNLDEIQALENLLKDAVPLLNVGSNELLEPLLELAEGSRVRSVGEWATYVFICAAHSIPLLSLMLDALRAALERHNQKDYGRVVKLCEENKYTRREFQLFGKDGMLSKVLLYTICVAGLSSSWDITKADDIVHVAMAQSLVILSQLNNSFASIQGVVGRLEDDLLTVFMHQEGMKDDNRITAPMFHPLYSDSEEHLPHSTGDNLEVIDGASVGSGS